MQLSQTKIVKLLFNQIITV